MAVMRMDNVGIVVENIDSSIEFFKELGLTLEGRMPIESDHRSAPVNSLGYLRVMFSVENIGDTLARLINLGATVVDEVVNYEDIYWLCYIRSPEGILIGLAQQLGQQGSRENPMEKGR